MKFFLSLDFGGSTIDIVQFSQDPFCVRHIMFLESSEFPEKNLESIFPKIENLLNESENIVLVTGGKTSFFPKEIFFHGHAKKIVVVGEFDAIGAGGLFLADKKDSLIVSLGTGSAMVSGKNKDDEKKFVHVGGTGIGGGTFLGLSRAIVHEENFSTLQQLVEKGNLKNIDLSVGEIVGGNIGNLSSEMTASNFAKFSEKSTKEDMALGIANLVAQSIATLAVEKAHRFGHSCIILGGKFSQLAHLKLRIGLASEKYGIETITPKNAEYMTAIGAAFLFSQKDFCMNI